MLLPTLFGRDPFSLLYYACEPLLELASSDFSALSGASALASLMSLFRRDGFAFRLPGNSSITGRNSIVLLLVSNLGLTVYVVLSY